MVFGISLEHSGVESFFLGGPVMEDTEQDMDCKECTNKAEDLGSRHS